MMSLIDGSDSKPGWCSSASLQLLCWTLLIIVALCQPIFAETPPKPPDFQIPRLEQPPKIDGQLSPGEWEGAVKLENFVQTHPGYNTPASEQMIVYLGYDSQNLYLAFDCRSSAPNTVRATVAKRDQIFNDDFVILILDTFNDQRRAFEFLFNPLGVQADAILVDGADEDFSFDTVHTSKGQLTDQGYVVEVAIPFRSLRYNKGGKWGLHILRQIQAKNEEDSWMPIERGNSILSQEGHFEGLAGLPRGRAFEIIPTFTLSELGERREAGGFLNHPIDATAGVSIKYNITPNLTLDLAIKPDFSQVEADFPQIDVNNRFPLFFQEKRPFFLEGADIFQTPFDFNLVQTRQIIAPLFAAKISGKVGKNSIGLLTALDQDATSLRFSDVRDEFFKNALFSIFRFKRDILTGSNVGLFISDREFAGSFNRVAGIDGRFRLGKRYIVGMQFVQTATKDLDGKFTSGHAALALLDFTDKHYGYFISAQDITSNYRVDSGFTPRTDTRELKGAIRYTFLHETAEAKLRRIQPNIFIDLIYNHAGQLTDRIFDPALFVELKHSTFARVAIDFAHIKFGGIDFDTKQINSFINTNFSKRFSGGVGFSYGDGIKFDESAPELGKELSYNFELAINATDKLRAELNLIHSELNSRNGREIFSESIYRAKINQQFSRNLSARAIIQYNTFDRRANGSLLLAYTPNPGTALYVGYNDLIGFGDDRDTSAREVGARRLQRAFFIKLSYLLRF